ncbi:MAG: DUF1801 domain-containing protein [Alphaproteobacteria bacterium]|nr:DUF1801 domain-containing protein [Alphaproteobacteria bacterium]
MDVRPHDPFLDAADEPVRARLRTLRALVHELVPEAEEVVSYRMPAFRRGRVFLYYGAFRHHVGVYPPVRGDEALIADLAPFRGPKGNLVLPHDQPFPEALVRRVVRALAG